MHQVMRPPTLPKLPKRYDKNFRYKFDYPVRIKPYSAEFRLTQRLWRQFQENGDDRTISSPKHYLPAFADIALRARTKVGIVLGSSAKRLYNRLEDFDEAVGSDFDVLILDEHTEVNPAPFEFDIDWFVRPDRFSFPTNGNIECVYDLSPTKEFTTVQSTKKRKYALTYKGNESSLRYDDEMAVGTACKDDGGMFKLEAGLYLPHPDTIEEIIQYCNALANENSDIVRKSDYSYLRPKIRHYDPAFPVLPPEVVSLRKRVNV